MTTSDRHHVGGPDGRLVQSGPTTARPKGSAIAVLSPLLLVGLGWLAGCARPAGPLFSPVDPAIVWPLPPDQPRVRYLGSIRSLDDLHPARTGWQALTGSWGGSDRSAYAGLVKPHAVAVAGNVVYVADNGSPSLHVFDLDRRTHVRIDHAGDTMLRSPSGVAVGDDEVFLADAALGKVFRFTRDGRFLGTMDIALSRPGGLAFNERNRQLFVIDTGSHECVVLGRSDE